MSACSIINENIFAQEPHFTARELEVLHLLCSCASRQEIADTLFISKGTVKRHVENMLGKSGCKSSMEMVVNVVNKTWIFAN